MARDLPQFRWGALQVQPPSEEVQMTAQEIKVGILFNFLSFITSWVISRPFHDKIRSALSVHSSYKKFWRIIPYSTEVITIKNDIAMLSIYICEE